MHKSSSPDVDPVIGRLRRVAFGSFASILRSLRWVRFTSDHRLIRGYRRSAAECQIGDIRHANDTKPIITSNHGGIVATVLRLEPRRAPPSRPYARSENGSARVSGAPRAQPVPSSHCGDHNRRDGRQHDPPRRSGDRDTGQCKDCVSGERRTDWLRTSWSRALADAFRTASLGSLAANRESSLTVSWSQR